ncbi:hypothetical protein JW935_15315 [candidate division KSB1 bacterium]|nr:hypothetical protein [candidate division KSB1 bacterium]
MIEYSRYDSPMSPHSFLSVVHKRRKLIIALFLVIVVAIVAVSFVLPPVYESKAKVMVNYQPELEKYHLLGLLQPGRSNYNQIASELVVLKMRSIVEPVVNSLGLDRLEAPMNAEEAARQHEAAIEKLSDNIKVEREKDTNVLIVSYKDPDPQFAANVVDKVITEYIEQRPSLDRDERAYEYFDKQIQVVKSQIDEIEQKGMAYKAQEKVLEPDKQTQILFNSIAEFDKELTKARANRIAKEARLKIYREQIATDESFVPSTEISSSYSRFGYLEELRKTILKLNVEKSALLKKYTEKHDNIIAINASIEEAKNKFKEEVDDLIKAEETAVATLREEENAIAVRMNQVVGSIAKLSRQEYELGKITIGVDDLKAVHSMLIRQREEARLAANKREYLVQVRLLEPAMVPARPVEPNKMLFAALAVILGFILSFGVAFFVEYFDHSVNTAEDAHHCLGLPILASIPDFETSSSSSGTHAGREVDLEK